MTQLNLSSGNSSRGGVFHSWGLKQLTATHYEPDTWKTVAVQISERSCHDPIAIELPCNGDFRSAPCIELLEQADIVVTNPPFSLFREYVSQLMEHDKKFIIIGNINAVTYKEFFPFIKNNRIWIGVSIHSGDREFLIPDDYPVNATRWRVDESGKKYIRVKGVRWYTNLECPERHEPLCLSRGYCGNECHYPKYDGYNAIEVSRTSEIPYDYDGIMGVPITFLDKYCPEQFEIIGLDRYTVPKESLVGGRLAINGKPRYARILVRRRK